MIGGGIDYTDLPLGLQHVKEWLEHPELSEELGLNDEAELRKQMESMQSLSITGKMKPTYLDVTMKFIPFEHIAECSMHVREVYPVSTPLFRAVEHVAELTNVQTAQIAVFVDKSRSKAAVLDEENTFWELGFRGGPKYSPAELTLFYDYQAVFYNCPVLSCDDYFTHYSRPLMDAQVSQRKAIRSARSAELERLKKEQEEKNVQESESEGEENDEDDPTNADEQADATVQGDGDDDDDDDCE